MDDPRYCRLRVHGDDLDLAGPAGALRALAATLRTAGADAEVAIRNGAVVQVRGDGPLEIELRGAPTLHLRGDEDGLARVWAALEAVADEADAGTVDGPHRHVDRLVVTGEREEPPL